MAANPRATVPSRRSWASDEGSSTVELALLTPLVVAVLLFVVLCGRLAAAQLDLDAAAHAAARAASLARTVSAANTDARRTALQTLAARRVTCPDPAVTIDTGGLRPGGTVTVTVSCRVPVHDLALLALPGDRVVIGHATSPIDRFRGGPA